MHPLRRIRRSTLTATVCGAIVAVALQTTAYAHFIWATVEDHRVRFALLENLNETPDAKFEKYVTDITPQCGGKALTPDAPKGGARYVSLPDGQNMVTADSILGAKDREGEPYLLVYHAKGAASLAAAGTSARVPIELMARREGQSLVVSVNQDGWRVPGCEVFVQWPGVESAVSFTTDFKGEARVDWPASTARGFVGMRAMVLESQQGEREGKKYASVHHWTTLTFPAPAGN